MGKKIKDYQEETKDYIQGWSRGGTLDTLRIQYDDYELKYLEEKAEWFHNFLLSMTDTQLHTEIKGNEKNGYVLDVIINKRNEEQLKCKENTHFQKTDL